MRLRSQIDAASPLQALPAATNRRIRNPRKPRMQPEKQPQKQLAPEREPQPESGPVPEPEPEPEPEDAEQGIYFREVRRFRSDPSTDTLMQLSHEDLISYIENARDQRHVELHIRDEEPPAALGTAFQKIGVVASEPATPGAAPQPDIPQSTGWGISSLFSRFMPSVFSPDRRPTSIPPTTVPATAPETPTATAPEPPTATVPETALSPPVLPQAVVEEIGAALTPIDTPSRPRGTKPKKASQTKNKRRRGTSTNTAKPVPAQRAIVNHAIRDLDSDQKTRALAWAKKTARKLATDPANLGEKRRRLEQPMKLKDVEEIPARRPWESSGSYGLLLEFFDDSDSNSDEDAEAPGWYMVDQLANEQPPMKKRKTGSGGSNLNANASVTPPQFMDSHGNSASLSDFHPRPSHIPSPMFGEWNPTTRRNIFEELHVHDRMEYERELKRTGHIPGSGAFCVPEGNSDSDDDSDNDDRSAEVPWTQQPPPAPTPAHASLPGLPSAPPVMDPVEGQPVIDSVEAQPVIDPVEAQRQRAMKFTPARQSRLREVMVPSPVTPAGDDMPEAMPLDFGDPQLEDIFNAIDVDQIKALDPGAFGGSTVVISYDEFDEVMTSDEGL